MQQNEKKLRLDQLRLLVIIFLIIFAFMLVYTIYWLIDYNKHYSFFVKTKADIVEHKEINDKTYDVISFSVDGNEFRIVSDYESKNEIGDEITIYYDENNPLGIVYSLDSRRFVLPILTIIFGIASSSLAVVYILINRSMNKDLNLKKNTE